MKFFVMIARFYVANLKWKFSSIVEAAINGLSNLFSSTVSAFGIPIVNRQYIIRQQQMFLILVLFLFCNLSFSNKGSLSYFKLTFYNSFNIFS